MTRLKKQRATRHVNRRRMSSRRRRAFALVAGIMLVGAVIAWPFAGRAGETDEFVPGVSAAPRVSLDRELVDYGDVRVDTNIETVFRVRNVGEQDLRILDNLVPVELIEGC